MIQKSQFTSITSIIAGSVLHFANGISGGWASIIASIFGLVLLYQGLSQLKNGLDNPGQGGVSLLMIAVFVSVVAAIVDLIPLMGILAGILYFIAFGVELVGYLRLKNSQTIGHMGRGGANLLALSMGMALLSVLFGLIPFLGGYLAGAFALVAMMCSFYGWLRIQTSLVVES